MSVGVVNGASGPAGLQRANEADSCEAVNSPRCDPWPHVPYYRPRDGRGRFSTYGDWMSELV